MSTTPIPVMNPATGDTHLVPPDQVQSAIAAGGKLASKMLDPQGNARWVPADQVSLAQQQGGTPVNPDQSFTVTPAPGESFAQTMQRAAAAGRNVSPQLIQQQTVKGLQEAPVVLGAAAAAGPVMLGTEAGLAELGAPTVSSVPGGRDVATGRMLPWIEQQGPSLARQGLNYATQKSAQFLASPVGQALIKGAGMTAGGAAVAKVLNLAKYLGLHE